MAIERSAFIISRSGYTTIMDLVKLGHPALLIPTPGQTEQEYLAKHLLEKKFFNCLLQKDISLPVLLKGFADQSFASPSLDQEGYKLVIKRFVDGLKER